MKNKPLALKIANRLLNAGFIIEDASPSEVQKMIEHELSLELRLRTAIIHLQDYRFNGPMPLCHQVGEGLTIADDIEIVTCQKCIGRTTKAT